MIDQTWQWQIRSGHGRHFQNVRLSEQSVSLSDACRNLGNQFHRVCVAIDAHLLLMMACEQARMPKWIKQCIICCDETTTPHVPSSAPFRTNHGPIVGEAVLGCIPLLTKQSFTLK
jgi:hypothetical protein